MGENENIKLIVRLNCNFCIVIYKNDTAIQTILNVETFSKVLTYLK